MSDSARPLPDPVHILLAEDNPADVRLLKEMLKRVTFHHVLHEVPDGEEAIGYLRRRGRYSAEPRPDLVLLDLNMPRRDGRSVLREVKGDPDLKRIPVIVLTSSQAEEDIRQAYDAHANCYLHKPNDLAQFESIVKKIEGFWFNAVELPSA
ncbi:MAG TPA: response regulator [Thermoplasmata archaeon]|nr:response regulator [Thermoplasmata archaeon]